MIDKSIEVERMEHVISVFGSFDQNLRLIESALNVNVTDREDQLHITGEDPIAVMHAEKAIEGLLSLAARGERIDEQNVRYILKMVDEGHEDKIGELAKDVVGPAGEVIFHSHDYFRTATVKINTNYRVCHLDGNRGGLQKAVRKYGQRVTVRNPGAVGCVTLLSNDPDLPAADVMKEFGIEEIDDYYARSVRLRGGEVPRLVK